MSRRVRTVHHLMPRNTQVAALPWRRGKAGLEILLVTTRTTKRWVIPKGWPMDGKADHEAAAQEAFEEGGVRGRVNPGPYGQYGYVKTSDKGFARAITVMVYALHVDEEFNDWPERAERERRWMTLAEAAERVGEPELLLVLNKFMLEGPTRSVWQRIRDWFS